LPFIATARIGLRWLVVGEKRAQRDVATLTGMAEQRVDEDLDLVAVRLQEVAHAACS
jgi:hypothetical protein